MNNKNNFNVAMLQISATKSLSENLKKGIEACKKAKEMGADIAVFPEAYSNSYEYLIHDCIEKEIDNLAPEAIKEWEEKAVEETSEFVQAFSNLAKELEMAIAITFLEKTEGKPKNSIVVFDRFGKKVLKYCKVHTCDYHTEYFMDSGDSFEVGTLDYENGQVQLGAMICYDRNFPEAARILMLKDAEIVIVPNASKLKPIGIEQFKVRAFENAMCMAMVNYPVNDINKSNGLSCAFHPISVDENDNPIEMQVIMIGHEEEIAIATFDIDKLRENRKNTLRGGAFRKPKAYKDLLKEITEGPFVRKFAK